MRSVSANDLAKAIAPFEKTKPFPGLVKILSHTLILGSALWVAWGNYETPLLFWSGTIIFSLFYPAALITTHDALHHTFTGLKLVDEVYPRLLSYNLFWCHGVYQQVHKLHHKMNGSNLEDPERVQLTLAEYQNFDKLSKFLARHQWFLSLFVFAGVGLIVKTFRKGFQFWGKSKAMRYAIVSDLLCIFVVNAVSLTYMYSLGLLLEYFYFWFVTQYVSGVVLQYRAFIEHYGLWGRNEHFYDTQVKNCRNIKTNAFGEWYFNGLCHHSVHHAFLKVPFYKLREAQDVINRIYAKSGQDEVIYEDGYLKAALKFVGRVRFIKEDPDGGLKGTLPFKKTG